MQELLVLWCIVSAEFMTKEQDSWKEVGTKLFSKFGVGVKQLLVLLVRVLANFKRVLQQVRVSAIVFRWACIDIHGLMDLIMF